MKYKIFLIILFLSSCKELNTQKYEKKMFNSKGFAYIYDLKDYENKLISRKLSSNKILLAQKNTSRGTLIKLTNPINNKYIVVKNNTTVNYPNFFNVMITKPIADKIGLDYEVPYIEIEEIKKNKSFVAEVAETFDEEKQLHDKAPVEKVAISNIGLSTKKKSLKKHKFVIILGNFYSKDSAKNLIKRVKFESNFFKNKKISIFKKKEHNFEVFLGPYNTINNIKNDYIALKQLNFEEIDIKIYD